ncbi:cytidine deaminase-like [Clavelina lepadiformis]|uniref:CMP/dCMP-type deaminase domain-containing protein n=1 Tax=Clavelina lepadiformis TaxID=159417 RepID=A0ABP0H3I7_CLALP
MSVSPKELVSAAKQAKDKYATTYFKMGAAVLTKCGKVFTGCSITCAVSPCSMCAERVAIFKAVSEGYKEFEALAVIGDDDTVKVSVCGMCRQVMRQYSLDMKAYCANNKEEFNTHQLNVLLPHEYGPNLS